jgi:hypothetical protein
MAWFSVCSHLQMKSLSNVRPLWVPVRDSIGHHLRSLQQIKDAEWGQLSRGLTWCTLNGRKQADRMQNNWGQLAHDRGGEQCAEARGAESRIGCFLIVLQTWLC